MKWSLTAALAAAALLLSQPAPAGSDADDGERAHVRKAAGQLLEAFYDARPRLRPEVKGAAGYAVFTTVGGNLVGSERGAGGRGVGIAVDARDDREVFMSLREAARDAKDAKGLPEREILIIFDNRKAFDEFASKGWSAEGGAKPADARVYSFDRNAVQPDTSLAGVRFRRDEALN